MKKSFSTLLSTIIVMLFLVMTILVFQKTSPTTTPLFDEVAGDVFIFPKNFNDYFERISQSQKIDLAIYTLTDEKVIGMIQKKNYRIFVEENPFSDGQSYPRLSSKIKNNIKTDKNLGVNFMHAKYMILDDSVAIQTNNFTYTARTKNREVAFITRDQKVMKDIRTLYDHDRNNDKRPLSFESPNTVVCPFNCREKITRLLQSAQKEIVLYQQSIEDDEIIAILEKQKKNVKAIVADNGDSQEFLQRIGGKKIKKPYIHAKVIIIDKSIALISSVNLTKNSMDKNREVGVITTDPRVINELLRQFSIDYSS